MITFKQIDNMDFDSSIKKLECLNLEETLSLQKEVQSWDSKRLYPAVRTLSKYYHTTLPEQFLKDVLCTDLDIAYEVYSNGVSDTSQREILIDMVMKKIGVPSWPLNCQNQVYVDDFFEKFRKKGKAAGITFQPD